MLNDKKLSIKCLILTVVGLPRFMTLKYFHTLNFALSIARARVYLSVSIPMINQ